MAELFNVKCKQGRLIITDQAIILERPAGAGQETISKQSYTGVESKRTVMATPFTKGSSTIIFHAGAMRLQVDLVETPIAEQIVRMLQGR